MSRPAQLAIYLSVFAVVIRLILIDQPYIDNWSWRQSDVASIARNYFQKGFHFAYPQIDWAGDQPGYVGTEFPVLPFIAALSYKIFGVHEWIGRIQTVAFFAASLPFLFLLVRETFGEAAAGWAIFFYSFAPLNLMAGRCFIPDVPSLSLSIIGLYFFLRWINNTARSTSFFASAAFISLSILIKAPSALIGVPLAYLAFHRFGFSSFRRIGLWMFAAIALIPSALWYWHAHEIAQNFYPHHFFGAGGIRIENFSWYGQIVRRTTTESLTPLLCILALIGLFVTPRGKYARIFYWWFAAMVLFIIVVGYGNRHPWYQLPLIPIAAAFAGAACVWLGSRLRRFSETAPIFVVVVAAVTSISFFFSYLRLLSPVNASLYFTGLQLKRTTPENSLIISVGYGDPTVFYYAERKGWHFLEKDGVYNGHPTDSAEATSDLEKLRRRGATHLVFYSTTFWWFDYYKEFAEHVATTATLMETTPQFKIYRLNLPKK